ncbi:IgGFc-binding protein [Teredinibacter purpureus]|uniref:IgGFc-binding protein n=1 Tax=Teredinibacter purpureus TaxID=2731756 RepID=UPI0005F88B35|nr:IgGFc-binding protein [Teredinibacter purpureus]
MVNCSVLSRQKISRNALRYRLLIAFILTILTPYTFAALDNKGTDFIMAFLPNYTGASTLQVHLTADTVTDVTVDYPVNSPTFNTTVTVVPGDVTVVDIPLSANIWTSNAVSNNAIRVYAAEEFVSYMVNLRGFTSDAALALPIDTMNTQYIVASYTPSFYGSQFTVYAAYDNTEVTITPTAATTGHPAGTPYAVTLNTGEAYFLVTQGRGAAADLSGTLIESSKPVGVINGERCTNVPNNISACDHIFEVAQPVQSWGTSALVANLPDRPAGSIYRIFASEDNTDILLDNTVIASGVGKGKFHETPFLAGEHNFSSDKPIFVVQYMPGQSSTGATTGDPAMGNMIPPEQYLNAYTFSTVGGAQFAEHYLTLIAHNADIGSVTLDGIAIPFEFFRSIPSSLYSAAVIQLSEGVHETFSPNGHGITIEGYNSYDSYIYPGGALFQFINPKGDPWNPICSLTPTATGYTGVATDNQPSEDINNNDILDLGEDTNANDTIDADTGIFIIEGVSLVNASVVVTPFTPGEPQANYSINILDANLAAAGSIVATDGAGNSCEVNFAQDVEPMQCDFDGDNNVDKDDVLIVRSARNTTAAPGDARDIDGDGTITLNDARACVTLCTLPRCELL